MILVVGVEHARPILLMCRNYCRLLEGSSMLDPYNEHHPETGYAPGTGLAAPQSSRCGNNEVAPNRDSGKAQTDDRPQPLALRDPLAIGRRRDGRGLQGP